MDPRYNWPPQAYANGQYNPYAPPQQRQQQQQQQQPNGYQQHGYPQYPPMQMQMSQGYPQSQPAPYQIQQQPVMPRPPTQQYQQYQQMPPHMQPPQHLQQHPQQRPQQQIQHQPQQRLHQQPQPQSQPQPQPQSQPQSQQQQPQPQPQYRSQPQVIIPARTPNYSSPMQMQPPRIRHVQVPVQRTNSAGISQTDGSADHQRRYSAQQTPTPAPPSSKPIQQSSSQQENGPRPQQRPVNAPLQHQNQQRAPLQPQTTPQQQRVLPPARTPSSQYGSPITQPSTAKPKTHPQVVIPRASSSHQLTPTKRPQPPQKALPAELSDLLLTAADEYIAAARGMGSLFSRERKEADMRQYYKLMSTAMGCMDTVLRDFNMPPRDEAKLRLRYASLMIEETDIEATDISSRIEEVLSKQISLCGRHRLQDLKFAALHLQARYQFKTNHRAGLKSLDKPISEAETFQHIAWVYALRFLKVTLALQIPGRVEVQLALNQLHAIQRHAESRGDRAIYVACCALEAMVHLRSSAGDRLEQVQRAIAAARSLQLQVSAKDLGSFGTLIDVIDLTSGIQNGRPDMQKATALLEATLGREDEKGGSETGGFTVLIERSFGGNLTFDTGGVFRKNAERKDELVFAWLPREDLKALCFHICALDHHVHEKGLIYMKEAHQRCRESAKRRSLMGIPPSVAFARIEWNMVLDWHSMFAIGLMACSRDDHAAAEDVLSTLKKRIALPPYNKQEAFVRTLAYLSSINDQRNGHLDSALSTSSSAILAVPEKGHATPARTDIAIMAALNRLLILRDPTHPHHFQASLLLEHLKPLCEDHANQYVRMTFRLVHAFHGEAAAISHQKKTVQQAVGIAQEISQKTQNFEFVAMTMCYFVARFFADTVGEKSIQAIRAARSQAIKSRRPLWIAVAAGLSINTYRRNGLSEEAAKATREFDAVRPQLPGVLRGEGEDDDVDAEGEEDADSDIDIVG
ncbi:cohesin loading factor [Stemphylium lycopersici]|uniref:Cohesin loading factor n=1 Tax=Stemphylium lycopersici TaxID=183478 RepID=A0A364N4B0_STELY|nr:cohesin loading factor [Stemphylium lycopersici]RAR02462.1 cohesin loading factor [Stemphylium lycopersici]RAR11461.1 cohesin loading factor [Stemphylium lycopersici]